MVDGGDCIQQAEWKTVSGIIQRVSLSVLNLTVVTDVLCMWNCVIHGEHTPFLVVSAVMGHRSMVHWRMVL